MKYGHWTVLDKAGKKSFVRCDCGVERWLLTCNLKRGATKSCGCSRATQDYGYSHPLYQTWRSMKRRCYLKTWRRYDRYGGRGIRVCARWLDGDGTRGGFQCFVTDVGERPPGTTLDRIDNDGHYEPGNVRWATSVEQQMNSSQMLGRPYNISALARESGVSATGIRKRLARGLTISEAVQR